MLALIASIVLASYLTLSFKVLERLKISTFQSIVFNYVACVVTGILLSGSFPFQASLFSEPWLPWAGLMGFCFIFLFNIIALNAQRLGVAVASVANKLSLVIPVIFSVFLYKETLGWGQVLGILLALVSVVLTTWPEQRALDMQRKKHATWVYLLPVVLFVGSGLLDTLVKYVEQGFINDGNKNAYLISSFGVAAALGLMMLLLQVFSGKEKPDWRALLAGILIGVPNYFSIWALMRVLKDYSNQSAAIIPINNMGVVLFSTIMAWLLFRENLSRLNRIGILLAVAAIALIAFA